VVGQQRADVPDVTGHRMAGLLRIAALQGLENGAVVVRGGHGPPLDLTEVAQRHEADQLPEQVRQPGRTDGPVDPAVDLVVQPVHLLDVPPVRRLLELHLQLAQGLDVRRGHRTGRPCSELAGDVGLDVEQVDDVVAGQLRHAEAATRLPRDRSLAGQ